MWNRLKGTMIYRKARSFMRRNKFHHGEYWQKQLHLRPWRTPQTWKSLGITISCPIKPESTSTRHWWTRVERLSRLFMRRNTFHHWEYWQKQLHLQPWRTPQFMGITISCPIKPESTFKTALMDAGKEALKVIYEEKQLSSLRILAKAVTLAAVVKHTTDMKKLGNHHFLSNQARINLQDGTDGRG